MEHLSKTGEIENISKNKYRMVKIVNYEKFQKTAKSSAKSSAMWKSEENTDISSASECGKVESGKVNGKVEGNQAANKGQHLKNIKEYNNKLLLKKSSKEYSSMPHDAEKNFFEISDNNEADEKEIGQGVVILSDKQAEELLKIMPN